MATQLVILTQRERQIARLVADGMTNQEIADLLDIADQTVKNHLRAIRRQIGARNRVELAVWVLRRGGVGVSRA